MIDFDKVWEEVKDLPNVNGIDEELRPRVKDGEERPGEECVRVFVEKKVSEGELRGHMMVPESIDGAPVDVVELGTVVTEGLKSKTRPLVAGPSIGNWSITCGTLGWFYKFNGQVCIGSNAHVLCSNPTKDEQGEERIVQPGKYDDGTLEDQVGRYLDHKVIHKDFEESTCPVSRGVTKALNLISKGLDRETRFNAQAEHKNKIDFALSTISVGWTSTIAEGLNPEFLGGHLFAGSDRVTIGCKVSNIVDSLGAVPVRYPYKDFSVGEKVGKVGRTTGLTEGKVESEKAKVRVNGYDGTPVTFHDVYILSDMSSGGDSGSSLWKV